MPFTINGFTWEGEKKRQGNKEQQKILKKCVSR